MNAPPPSQIKILQPPKKVAIWYFLHIYMSDWIQNIFKVFNMFVKLHFYLLKKGKFAYLLFVFNVINMYYIVSCLCCFKNCIFWLYFFPSYCSKLKKPRNYHINKWKEVIYSFYGSQIYKQWQCNCPYSDGRWELVSYSLCAQWHCNEIRWQSRPLLWTWIFQERKLVSLHKTSNGRFPERTKFTVFKIPHNKNEKCCAYFRH